MDIYLVFEECHGLIGIFSTEEKGINFLKEKWGLEDNYNSESDNDGNSIELWDENGLFTIEKKELDKPL